MRAVFQLPTRNFKLSSTHPMFKIELHQLPSNLDHYKVDIFKNSQLDPSWSRKVKDRESTICHHVLYDFSRLYELHYLEN